MCGRDPRIGWSILPLLCGLTLFCASGARSAPNGLTQIPIAKNVTFNSAYAQPNTAGDPLGDGTNPCGYVVNLPYVFHLKGQRSSKPGTNKNPAAGAGGAGK